MKKITFRIEQQEIFSGQALSLNSAQKPVILTSDLKPRGIPAQPGAIFGNHFHQNDATVLLSKNDYEKLVRGYNRYLYSKNPQFKSKNIAEIEDSLFS